MNKRAVAYAVGKLMQILALVLFVPLFCSLLDYPDLSIAQIACQPEVIGFIFSIVLSAAIGSLLSFLTKSERSNQGVREGFGIVSLGWVCLTFLGSFPFLFYFAHSYTDVNFSIIFKCFTDSYFEIMSGFTTTGATILTDVEALPHSLLFWRSFTHWLGGMGIITLAIVVFPAMGISGYQMFKGEVPGPTTDRLLPKLAGTAKILWGVYLLMTVAETVLLWVGGMNLFDSLCHTFGTLATGGFSTKNASIGYYQSEYIEWVITVFMFLAGVNFLVHYNVLCGNFKTLKQNSELHFYSGTLLVAIVLVAMSLFHTGLQDKERVSTHYHPTQVSQLDIEEHRQEESARYENVYQCIRSAVFQVVAITTTTGYTTADYDLWPNMCRYMLLILMFWGACAGSTGGGMKMVRIMVVFKTAWREIKKVAKPRLIESIRVGDSIVSGSKVINIMAFICLYLIIFTGMTFFMSFFIPDLMTAIASVAATINNIGPGLSGVGPVENYSWIPLGGKWILIACMILGRLEIFTVLVILRPSTWKK